MADFNLGDYETVAERRARFYAAFPEGSLQPWEPPRREVLADGTEVWIYSAAAYRGPRDPRPGIAFVTEPAAGATPYTRNSELMNAETSAWGRAIAAVLPDAPGQSGATRDEVQNRRDEEPGGVPGARPAPPRMRHELEQLVDERGLPVGCPWPLPVDLTMPDAAKWIGAAKTRPRETPKPEHRATMREEPQPEPVPVAMPTPGTDGAGTPASEGAGAPVSDEARPWRRRAFPFTSSLPQTRSAYWAMAMAALPGVGPAKLLGAARDIAAERGLPVPDELSEIENAELVDALQKWCDARADLVPLPFPEPVV